MYLKSQLQKIYWSDRLENFFEKQSLVGDKVAVTDLNRQSVFHTFIYLNMFEHVDERAEARVVYILTLCKASSDWLPSFVLVR